MFNRKIKKLALFLVFFYIFLVGTKYTDADIFAERVVVENKFSAINLDLFARASFNNNQLINLFRTSGIQPGGFDLGAVKIKANPDRGFKYQIKAKIVSGDQAFCQALKIEVYTRNFRRKFSGSLMDLAFNSELEKDRPEDWIFLIALDDNSENLKNKICEFNFNFKTYRSSPNENGGIFAERSVSNIITSSSW